MQCSYNKQTTRSVILKNPAPGIRRTRAAERRTFRPACNRRGRNQSTEASYSPIRLRLLFAGRRALALGGGAVALGSEFGQTFVLQFGYGFVNVQNVRFAEFVRRPFGKR
jgi:hypothetical protein